MGIADSTGFDEMPRLTDGKGHIIGTPEIKPLELRVGIGNILLFDYAPHSGILKVNGDVYGWNVADLPPRGVSLTMRVPGCSPYYLKRVREIRFFRPDEVSEYTPDL